VSLLGVVDIINGLSPRGEKIISRKAAKPRRDGVFLCDLASLREINHFTQSREAAKGNVFLGAFFSKSYPSILPIQNIMLFFLKKSKYYFFIQVLVLKIANKDFKVLNN
jgi:hypothetical protein